MTETESKNQPGSGGSTASTSNASTANVSAVNVLDGQKSVTGIVTSDKMQKTRCVRVTRLERHPKYGKYLRRHTTYYAHDEKEVSHVGDTVRIVETRPLSRTKRWRLVEVLVKSKFAGTTPLDAEAVQDAIVQGGAQ